MAKDRTGVIVVSASPRVQHLPMYWNSRNASLKTKCNKLGFFRRAEDLARGTKIALIDLPWCSECERKGLREQRIVA